MFCGNCGTKIADGADFCPECGTRMNAGETPTPVAAEKSSKSGKPIGKAVCAVAIIGILLALYCVFGKKPVDTMAFYVKDGDMFANVLKNNKETDVDNTDEVSSVYVSHNKKYIFYEEGYGNLYYAKVSRLEEEGKKLAKNVNTWTVTNSNKVVYCDTDGELYISDLKDEERIDRAVNNYYVDVEKDAVYWLTSSGDLNYAKLSNLDKSKEIDSHVNRIIKVSDDYSCIAYETNDGVYVSENTNDAVRLFEITGCSEPKDGKVMSGDGVSDYVAVALKSDIAVYYNLIEDVDDSRVEKLLCRAVSSGETECMIKNYGSIYAQRSYLSYEYSVLEEDDSDTSYAAVELYSDDELEDTVWYMLCDHRWGILADGENLGYISLVGRVGKRVYFEGRDEDRNLYVVKCEGNGGKVGSVNRYEKDIRDSWIVNGKVYIAKDDEILCGDKVIADIDDDECVDVVCQLGDTSKALIVVWESDNEYTLLKTNGRKVYEIEKHIYKHVVLGDNSIAIQDSETDGDILLYDGKTTEKVVKEVSLLNIYYY